MAYTPQTWTDGVAGGTPISAARLNYIEAGIAAAAAGGGAVSDATSSAKGVVQLAGDLGGTAASPTVPGLATKIDATTAAGIAAGMALVFGG